MDPGRSAIAGRTTVDDGFSEDEFNSEPKALFFLKRSKLKFSQSALSRQKFHVSSEPVSELTACSMQIGLCEPVGDELPDLAMLCRKCKQARPDLYA